MPTLYIPSVKKEPKDISGSGEILGHPLAEELARRIIQADWQRRSNPHRHDLLFRAAEYKAADMRDNNYFGHVSPTGEASTDYIRAYGYVLPSYFLAGKNYCESLAIHSRDVEETIAAWLSSPSHQDHVTGDVQFFQEQDCIGCGYAKRSDGTHLWVFISCPCMS